MELFRMDGKVALVTGASRGIGAASAAALAECGCDLVVAARNAGALEEAAARIEAASGRRVETVATDLSDLGGFELLVGRAKNAFGRLDVLVNNVGGSFPRPFLDTSTRFMERAFRWNVLTAFEATRLAVPLLLGSDGAAVVNVSSSVGHLADRGYVGYGTAKAALDHMTELLAAELAPRVRVNAVAPGSIQTDALDAVLDEGMRAKMVEMTPLRRLGRVEDVAAAVVYLASPAGSYLTGKVIHVDGGLRVPNLPLGLPEL